MNHRCDGVKCPSIPVRSVTIVWKLISDLEGWSAGPPEPAGVHHEREDDDQADHERQQQSLGTLEDILTARALGQGIPGDASGDQEQRFQPPAAEEEVLQLNQDIQL